MNWALLGDGEHTVVAYDDGVEFAHSTFEVGTTGEEFVRGASARVQVPDFPSPGETTLFVWNESTQHLELVRVDSAGNEDGALREAIRDNDAGRVRALLAAGADVNARDDAGQTPLHYATQLATDEPVFSFQTGGRVENGGDSTIVRVLLAAEADPNARDNDGRTSLYLAGTAEVARLLLDAGADVNARDNAGWTPLHWSTVHGTAEVVRVLLDAGADPNARDNDGRTPDDLIGSS